MTRSGRNPYHSRRARRIIFIGIAALLAGACQNEQKPSVAVLAEGTVPECPGDGFRFTADTGHGVVVLLTEVPGIAGNTDIPEFNDCQRFVKGDGTYDTRYAIFAPPTAGRLDSIWSDALAAHPSVGSRLPVRVLAAVVYSWGGTYNELGIGPDFNCLLMYQANNEWQATMLHLGRRIKCPVEVVGELQADETPLATHQVTPPRAYGRDDYPDVARWDWDARHRRQYISIKCAPIWCEITGKAGTFEASPPMTSSATFPSNAGPAMPDNSRRRTVEVRGWYDEQQLATTGASGLVPGPVRGRIWPAKGLGTYNDDAAFEPVVSNRWVLSAYVNVTADYFKGGRLLLHEGDSRISLCHGSVDKCRVDRETLPAKCKTGAWDWWSRIDPPNGGRPYYFCVTKTSHTGHEIPAAARWRWDEGDETMWIRCTAGCCKLEA